MSCVILLLMRNMVSFHKVWCGSLTLTYETLFLIPFLFNCPRCIVVLHSAARGNETDYCDAETSAPQGGRLRCCGHSTPKSQRQFPRSPQEVDSARGSPEQAGTARPVRRARRGSAGAYPGGETAAHQGRQNQEGQARIRHFQTG